MLLSHSALPVREAGVSRSAFPLHSEEAGIRYRLLKRLLKKKERGSTPSLCRLGGRRRAQLIHSTSWRSAAKGIPTEISANMEMNLAECFLHPFFFILMGFLQALGECPPFTANIYVLGFLVDRCLQRKEPAPSPCKDNGTHPSTRPISIPLCRQGTDTTGSAWAGSGELWPLGFENPHLNLEKMFSNVQILGWGRGENLQNLQRKVFRRTKR